LINLQSYLLILQPNGQILFETKLVVEKQEKKVGFTFQEERYRSRTEYAMIRFNQKKEAKIMRKV